MAPPRMLLALCGLLAMAGTAFAYSGDGTAYSGCGEHDKTGSNACGLRGSELSGRWDCFYAALPMGCGNKSDGCGECINVCGAKGCEVVKVIDQCASCSCGDVDLSTNALEAITGFTWDRKPITWEWVSCDGASPNSSDEESDGSVDSNNKDSKDTEDKKKKKMKKNNKKDRRLVMATARPRQQ